MHKKHLALPQELAANCRDHLGVVVRAHERQNRMPRLGRSIQSRHFTDSGDRHLECSRNGCRAHGQYIHIGFEGFQQVFVLHTEALFLIDDD